MTWRDPEQYRPSPQHDGSTVGTLFEAVDRVVPDVTRRKHQGNPESEAANRKINPRKQEDRQRIFGMAVSRGDYGITLKEVVAELGIPIQSASARLSELRHQLQMLRTNGERRLDCAVLVPVFAEAK